MVDFDQRKTSHAHSAGLKRLSARAQAPPNTGGRRVFFSFAAYARTAVDHLRNCGVPVEKGLSDEEFARVEAAYGFTFPPDLRAILQEGLPVGVGFPNWRHGSAKQLQMRFDLPTAGLLYEVARANVWWKQWGPRPVDTEQAVRLALVALRKAPILVPVYSHCYIPASPNLAGNPIFFVYLKDVFISGIDIADFFQRDQFTSHDYQPPTKLPDFLDWIEDGGGRVMRMGSGRDLLKERARMLYGKENLIVTGVRVGDDENNNSSSTQESQQQHESVAAAAPSVWRLSDAALTANTEESERKRDGLDRDVESWGRNLDTLVAKHSEDLFKSLDNFGRRPSSKSLDYNSTNKSNNKEQQQQQQLQQQQQQRLTNFSRAAAIAAARGRTPVANKIPPSSQDAAKKFSYFEETPLSTKTLMHFSMNAPPWAAKAARHIEFWSELTEKRQMTSGHAPETLFSAHKVDCDVANLSQSFWGWEDATTTAPSPKEAMTKLKSTFVPKWVVSYLDDISLRLRKGGWKEDDIEEIMETSPPGKQLPEMENKQSVLDALSRQAETLSSSLREAGWSIRDVAEVLNVDLSFGDHRRTASKLSPELAARLSTFAEYVVNA